MCIEHYDAEDVSEPWLNGEELPQYEDYYDHDYMDELEDDEIDEDDDPSGSDDERSE